MREAIDALPPLPRTTAWLLELLRDPAVEVPRLIETIEKDAQLSEVILQLCNSARFRRSERHIESLNEALVLLGNEKLATFAFALGVGRLMRHALGIYGYERNALWAHSLSVAYGASYLLDHSEHARYRNQAFTAGLVHDIGKVVMNKLLAGKRAAKKISRADTDTITTFEREYLGIDHAELGAIILDQWNFGEAMIQGVRYHHQAEQAEKFGPLVRAVSAADVFSNAVGLGPAGRAAEIEDPDNLPSYGFPRKVTLALISELPEKTKALVQMTT